MTWPRARASQGHALSVLPNKEELFKAVVRENIVTPLAEAAQEMREFDGPARAGAQPDHRVVEDFGSTHAGGLTKLLMAESGNFPEIAAFFSPKSSSPGTSCWVHRSSAASGAMSSGPSTLRYSRGDDGAARDVEPLESLVRRLQHPAG